MTRVETVQAHPVDLAAGERAESTHPEPRKLVGVIPAAAALERGELFGALEGVFPVRFKGCEPGEAHALDGLLAIDARVEEGHEDLSESVAPGCPRLVTRAENAGSTRPGGTIAFSQNEQLERLLRGRKLPEECAPLGSPHPVEGEDAIAHLDGRAVWWRKPGAIWSHRSAFGLEELAGGEALRDRLRGGHFMGLLPLLHLLRHVCGELAWEERPLSAAFVIDDPNLHAASYGYLNYREVIAHSERHGYHMGLATVPLDGWMSSRRTAELVKANPRALSLLMHGNSHLAGELGRLTDERAAQSALAQALCRISAFERRSDVVVERVMAPPHELCSTEALAAMFRLGFEGACIGRRHPWRDEDSLSRLTCARLLKWHPTDLMDAGLPIVPRHAIEHPRDDLVFAAYLRQPLIVFGHHWDFAGGLDQLEEAANYLNGLGDVRWGSVGSIARNCFFTRRSGETLHVQMHSRRVLLDVPEGVSVVRVSTSSLIGDEPQRQLVSGAADVQLETIHGGWVSDALPASPGSLLELKLTSASPLDPTRVAHPKPTPWPIVRRLLVEGRDRARPLLRR